MKKCATFLLFIFSLLYCLTSIAAPGLSPHATSQQSLTTGNFALSASQEPGPLVSFGQNVIDKDTLQLYTTPSYLQTTTEHFLAVNPSLLYGLSEKASILLSVPVALNYKFGSSHSSGLADALVQVEYAFYDKSFSSHDEQATFISAVSLPTGSAYKTPATGYGSPFFFFGNTYNETYEDWLWFLSPGALITTTHNHLRFGSQYLYQGGIGRNLLSAHNKYIFLALLEIDGQYIEKTKFFNEFNPNTGGNVILITPSIWFSTTQIIAQVGIGYPVIQHMNGDTGHNQYYLAASLAWTL